MITFNLLTFYQTNNAIMMKSLLKIENATLIEKGQQNKLNGGLLPGGLSECGSGCYQNYDCPGFTGNGHLCVVPGPSGEDCFGAIQNGLCCI